MHIIEGEVDRIIIRSDIEWFEIRNARRPSPSPNLSRTSLLCQFTKTHNIFGSEGKLLFDVIRSLHTTTTGKDDGRTHNESEEKTHREHGYYIRSGTWSVRSSAPVRRTDAVHDVRNKRISRTDDAAVRMGSTV